VFSTPASQPLLRLDPSLGSKKDLAKIRDNLSAIVLAGNHVWLGGDEGTHLHRMTRDAGGDFSDHKRFDLLSLLELPDQGPKPSEIDIEGLDIDEGYVWLVGSHSRKRKKVEKDETPAQNLQRLATVEADGNRYTLARVPLDDDQNPTRRTLSRAASRLEGDASGNLLTRALTDDEHVGPFCSIPSKDNGLDVEGLAVRGDRVFVGMRGPVLRGWAVLLDLEVRAETTGFLQLTQAIAQTLSSARRPWDPGPRHPREGCLHTGRTDDGPRWAGFRVPLAKRARHRQRGRCPAPAAAHRVRGTLCCGG